MRFENFITEGKVRRRTPDLQLAKALVRMAESSLQAMGTLPVTAASASPIMVAFYEALRQVVEAMAVRDGFRVYSHEALTAFLEQKKAASAAAAFDRFRRIRNGINYYGNPVDPEAVTAYKMDIKQMIDHLKATFLRDL